MNNSNECCSQNYDRRFNQISLYFNTRINELICRINRLGNQIKLDCITCSEGIPVLLGVRNAFLLGTDINGKIIVNNDVYTKEEVDALVGPTDSNLDQILTNGNTSTKNIILSNNPNTFNTTYSPFGINFNTSLSNWLAGLQSPIGNLYFSNSPVINGNNIYFTSSVSGEPGTQPKSLVTLGQLSGYIPRVIYPTHDDVDESGPEALLIVTNDVNNSGNIGMYYRDGIGRLNWIIAQPFNY